MMDMTSTIVATITSTKVKPAFLCITNVAVAFMPRFVRAINRTATWCVKTITAPEERQECLSSGL